MYRFSGAENVLPDADATAVVDRGLVERPRKLRRTNPLGSRGSLDIEPENLSPSARPPSARSKTGDFEELQAPRPIVSHSRGATACQRCRVRKSRCDNQRPNCSNCLKFLASCVYDSEISSLSQDFGPQILSALDGLATLLQSQKAEPSGQKYQREAERTFSSRSLPSIDFGEYPPSDVLPDARTAAQSRNAAFSASPSYPLDENVAPRKQRLLRQSLESVFDWRVYSSRMKLRGPIGEKGKEITSGHQLPSLGYAELTRLELKYIDGVHIKNPILDLPSLHQMILQVAENGLDWSTQTCLVALVCSIGALAERYNDPGKSGDLSSSSGTQYRLSGTSESETDLAFRYWDVAAKRLGYAIGQNSLEAVQCLCLAGIWYMFQVQPVQAWKYFNLAGTAWYAATLKEISLPEFANDIARNKSLSLEQSLYFTIYKSDCELQLELDLPGSVLEDAELSQTFPVPPSLDSYVHENEPDVIERGWYYYLAEIAARHLINRLLRARSWTQVVASNREARRLLSEVELFEVQLHEWHSSLPPFLKFDIPLGRTIQPHCDDLIQILRHRYLTSRELIYRPFVRLCVENPLSFLDHDVLGTVATLASRGLQYCMYKLTQISPHRHQGTWFTMRNHSTSAAILIAASLASKDETLLGAAYMVMPDGWMEAIRNMLEKLHPYWDDNSGGVAEIRRAIEWALSINDS